MHSHPGSTTRALTDANAHADAPLDLTDAITESRDYAREATRNLTEEILRLKREPGDFIRTDCVEPPQRRWPARTRSSIAFS